MSGIYVPGMDADEYNELCEWARIGANNAMTGRKPCVPVPDHGRLGDLDDVINDVRHYLCEGCGDYFGPDAKTESCDYCRGTMLIKAIERKSSIIPADKNN